MSDVVCIPLSRIVALFVVVLCFLSLVDGMIPQLELYFLGWLPVSEYMIKGILLAAVLAACAVYPTPNQKSALVTNTLLCVGYLLADILYLNVFHNMTIGVILQSYSTYYPLLLMGPALLTFRGRVSHRVVVRCALALFLVCAAIGASQYFKGEPLVYTESPDGAFVVDSWSFIGQVRAFSLFSSAMNFGIFCALCGALGVALSRTRPLWGLLLLATAAIACFATLTRLSYLVFFCVCSYALILTFGKGPSRGLWHPLLYFVCGLGTIVVGISSLLSGSQGSLQDVSSLLERLGQWSYYSDFLRHSSLSDQLFGVGIVQNEKILPPYPMNIDNVPLALTLHIGVIGLILFSVLLFRMWLYLRRQAIATRQPVAVAAASLWAALACAGIFNIVFSSFGVVFALAILCTTETRCRPVAANSGP